MKRLFACSLLALASVAFGATTVPVQLITPIAANTVVANATGSTASPSAVNVPNCNSTAAALGYANGVGFNCNITINASSLNGTTFAAPGPIGSTTPSTGAFTTLSSTGNFTPSQTNGIVGTTTNNNANAGSVGEYLTVTGGPTSASSGVALNATSITLGAGDWDVQGVWITTPAGSTVQTGNIATLSTTSGIFGAAGTGSSFPFTASAGSGVIFATPVVRESLSGSTTIFLVGSSTFTTSTLTVTGIIRARRVR